ncbi:MAG TPA: SMC family ATPase [Dehalococcoidales bacterium]|nr:SMC family ATPase [Dehalococcoidales bacterium]
MIPVKLKMHNFMCYRDNVPPLQFDGIHTTCLSGDNGNGKSALIDAMTWALWGQARAKSDDDLIHSGQSEMEVEFDFAVGQQTYRIIRKRSKPKRQGASGQPLLELQIATGDGFRPISDNTIAQTQQNIIDILHMDYHTFINSAFLRQGNADEFTIKRPTERKEVLADILGLSIYDELEAQAKELAKQQEADKAQLESTIQEIIGELAQKPTYQAEFEKAQSELSQIEKATKEKESRLNKLRQEKEVLERKKIQLDQLESHIRERERSLELLDEQIKQHHSRIKEYQELIARRVTIEKGYAQFTEAKKLNDELNQKLGVLVKLNERKSQLISAIDSAQATLVKDHALMQNEISRLETESQQMPRLKDQLQQLQVQLRQMAEQEETLSRKKQAGRELQTQINYLESSKNQLEKDIKEIAGKLDLLSAQTEAKCPLCERELEINSLKLIESKYAAERQSKSDYLKSNQDEIAQKKVELESLEKEIAQMEAPLNQEKISVQSQAGIIRKEMAESEEAAKQLVAEKEKLDEVELRLARKDFATIEQEALGKVEGELDRLDYNSERHEQARQQLSNLQQYESPKQKLEEADRLISQEKEATAKAELATQELRQSLAADTQKRQVLTTELTLLPQMVNDVAQAEAEHQTTAIQQKQAQETLWSVKAKLEHCSELEAKKKEKESLVTQTSKQESIYKELAKAFGKGGIQAMLIETALPEIEVEANRLLGRMTDNRMHVKFETQRESKKGDVIETLDINISDELGMRNYEMFSGGEAFRINFAIRVALSKLLARRAGAPLPTLIIDEGFGTQDSTGIEKVKEAINSIQDDFDKIIVITHIEEFRDAFPTRIDVIKTAEGSTLSVS